MPGVLSQTNKARHPSVVDPRGRRGRRCSCFGPFPSWNRLVGVVTGATAIMYAFAPVSLAALQLRDRDRPRPYRMPAPKVLLPLGFVSANLIIYWGGFEFTWKLAIALIVGLILFGIGTRVAGTDTYAMLKPAAWIGPWILGCVLIGAIGRYGTGSKAWLGEWWDLAVVAVFSLAIFYWAVRLTLPYEEVQIEIAKDSHQIDYVGVD